LTFKTHLPLGFLAGLATLYMLPNADLYVTLSGACIGALMPDLDTKKSIPSQLFPPVAFVVDKLTKHRGFTHTMFPLILMLLYFAFGYYPALVMGIGGLSHLVIDVLTLKLGIKCGSRGEDMIYYSFWVSIGIVAVNIATQKYNL
jgi:membrane-bound metal-dependent hydrolase YbcI (DUF457 family)